MQTFPVQLFPSKGIIISTFRSLEIMHDWCIFKETREIIQLGLQNRNALHILFSVQERGYLGASEPSKSQCMLCNQGSLKSLRLKAEKELGACTGQLTQAVQDVADHQYVRFRPAPHHRPGEAKW